jgi:hypothetical protein
LRVTRLTREFLVLVPGLLGSPGPHFAYFKELFFLKEMCFFFGTVIFSSELWACFLNLSLPFPSCISVPGAIQFAVTKFLGTGSQVP